jgi:hypothetical protein
LGKFKRYPTSFFRKKCSFESIDTVLALKPGITRCGEKLIRAGSFDDAPETTSGQPSRMLGILPPHLLSLFMQDKFNNTQGEQHAANIL